MISKEKLVEILDKHVRGYITRPVLEITADRILAALKEEHVASQPQDGLREALERYLGRERSSNDKWWVLDLQNILSLHPSSTGESPRIS